MSTSDVSRRSFVKAAALGGAALGLTAAGTALADEATESPEESGEHTYADTIAWNAEYDVVVLGMGFAGMSAALAAADAGASVLLCEKMEEGEAGGNSKVCAQGFIDGNDNVEGVAAYLRAMAGGRQIGDDVVQTMAEGLAVLPDTIAARFGMDASQFVAVPGSLSPEYPELEGGENIVFTMTHSGVGDSYFYQSVKRVLAANENVDVWFETPGVKLIQEPSTGTVIGVQVSRKGEDRNVRALNGVCVCTGGFEDNPEMVQHYLDVIDYAVIGGLHNTGDGILMCQQAGARLWHMGAYERDCQDAMAAVSYDVPEGSHANMVALGENGEMYNGASMLVGAKGKRFANEVLYTRHGHMDDGNGIWENPRFSERTWMVWDQTQNDLIESAAIIPESYAGDVQSFDTVSDLAAAIEADEATLTKTIEDFGRFATDGEDFECGRDVATMRPFDGVKYYALRVKNAILNTQGGPERNGNAEVIDVNGNPIPHLYSAGEMGGFTTCMYNGGGNVSECIIFGGVAGTNAAAAKDPLPAYAAPAYVESTPQRLGEENDLAADEATSGSTADGLLVGTTSTGMGGRVSVAVTLDADGKIAKVEVTRHSETEGIGTMAIDQMPAEFVGLSTAEEIDALDAVSGATVTSTALKAAVKAALGLE